jgi:hypothetical protein
MDSFVIMKSNMVEKVTHMKEPVAKAKQMQAECESWKKMLETLVHENVNLKTRLAHMLKANRLANGSVEAAEQFQNQFMLTDDVVSLARRDVSAQDKLLQKTPANTNGVLIRDVIRKHIRLRKELVKIDKAFQQLKGRFNHFLEKQES